MMFEPGTYYIGDPGYVLPPDDLRMFFSQAMVEGLQSGPRELVTSHHFSEQGILTKYYWIAVTPNKSGTIYDQQNNGWGFDWGCFGVVPWEYAECKGSYESNKIEFNEPFECKFTDDSITIGHLHFTFNPK